MADASIKSLIHLLGPDQPGHVRTAAALVLGELGDRDGEIGAALCDHLNDAEPAVRVQVITAVSMFVANPLWTFADRTDAPAGRKLLPISKV